MHDGHPRGEALVATTEEANPAVRGSEIGAQVEARLREMWQLPRNSRNDDDERSAAARFSVEKETDEEEEEKEAEGAKVGRRVDDSHSAYADEEWAALRALVERQGGDRAFTAAGSGGGYGACGSHQEAINGLAGMRLTCVCECYVKVALCHRCCYHHRCCRRCCTKSLLHHARTCPDLTSSVRIEHI